LPANFNFAKTSDVNFGCPLSGSVKSSVPHLWACFAQFYLFRRLLGLNLEVPTPEFLFAMQLAMLAGFVTSYPANWWLVKVGAQARM